ncbi:tetratricopeptide repeat protein [Vibrio salinus]|uniref:tetratricopeptide repeat protein n=1 Tax=Vibrio salinus TaxID=2899784 RepID=UPI001E5BEFAB|nr:hypothetical protein [Vibrio salinus]MCE0492672.1 hypothetical protein [Vibrio salinus]
MKYITVVLLLLISTGAFGNNFNEQLEKARQNDPQAQYDVASYYLFKKDNDAQNSKLALYWFETAAENGNQKAQAFLAQEYQQGLLAKKNNQLAVYWLTVLAFEGQDSAKLELAHFFKTHPNPKLDFTELWLRIAAKHSAEGEKEYSKYLETKFNERREEQLSDSQQIESAFEQTDNTGMSGNKNIKAASGDKITSDWLFWLLMLVPIGVFFAAIHLFKTTTHLKQQISQHHSSVDQHRSSLENKIQKQKQQINLLFKELKRSKSSAEKQKLSQACATFGYTTTSIPDKHKIKIRYKQLSKIYHPDMKGSDEEMQRLNQALKIILSQIR